jgi:hypothetical protein
MPKTHDCTDCTPNATRTENAISTGHLGWSPVKNSVCDPTTAATPRTAIPSNTYTHTAHA